jgi:hypothetical protein
MDMPINDTAKAVLERANALSEQRYEPGLPAQLHYGRLEPLHLLAAVLAMERARLRPSCRRPVWRGRM